VKGLLERLLRGEAVNPEVYGLTEPEMCQQVDAALAPLGRTLYMGRGYAVAVLRELDWSAIREREEQLLTRAVILVAGLRLLELEAEPGVLVDLGLLEEKLKESEAARQYMARLLRPEPGEDLAKKWMDTMKKANLVKVMPYSYLRLTPMVGYLADLWRARQEQGFLSLTEGEEGGADGGA